MVSGLKALWGIVEERNATLFYIAGGLLVISLLEYLAGFFRIADTLRVQYINLGSVIFNPLSSILAFLAILGLFPVHSDRAPRSARSGALFLGLAIIISAGYLIGNTLSMISRMVEMKLAPAFTYSIPYIMISLVAYGGTYLLFSYAVFETNSYPRLLGYVLLIPAFVQFVWFAEHIIGFQNIPMPIQRWISLSLHFIEMLALLGLGYILNNPEKFTNIQLGHYFNRTQHRA